MNDHIPTYDEELATLNDQIRALTEKRNVVIHSINRKKVEEVFGNIFNKVFEHKLNDVTKCYIVFEDIVRVSSSGYSFSCYQFTPITLDSFNVQYYSEVIYVNKEQFSKDNIEKFETSDACIKLMGHLNRIKQFNLYE